MKQEEKEILLKDLCARVPYHPKGHVVNVRNGAEFDAWLTCATVPMFTSIANDCRLYLRTMSSMTKEEKNEYELFYCYGEHDWDNYTGEEEIPNIVDWLNARHFDYRHLIEKGLAIEAPEKMYIDLFKGEFNVSYSPINNSVEYTRTDAFIEKALKWYCLDCECNDNCKDIKCFFYREYERYLKGEANAIPPKFSDRIINEDGSVSENYRYRHFINRVQEAFIKKTCEWLRNYLEITGKELLIEDFKNYIERRSRV